MFSIIIPAYNAEKDLPTTLKALLLITSVDDEIIVVNDGSTDSTDTICHKFLSKIKYKKIENSGCGIARNVGLSLSEKDYVIFVDSDDLLTKRFLDECRNVINNGNNYDVFFGRMLIGESIVQFDSNKIDYVYMCKNYFTHSHALSSSSCGKVFKKVFISNLSFQTGFYEDNVFMLNIWLKKPIIFYSKTFSYYYKQNTTSITKTKNYYKYRDYCISASTILFEQKRNSILYPERVNGIKETIDMLNVMIINKGIDNHTIKNTFLHLRRGVSIINDILKAKYYKALAIFFPFYIYRIIISKRSH